MTAHDFSPPISPRTQYMLFGHDAAEQAFLTGITTKRLHHAWLISGPRGVGKATLGWRLARFLLGAQRDTTYGLLGTAPDDPLSRLVSEGTYGNLFVLEPPVDEKTGRRKRDIPVEAVRRMGRSLSQRSAHAGRWRIVLVDTADALNTNAANALLKTLEEPPRQVLFLLLAHMPGRLLATLRSRCRSLKLEPLSDALTLKALENLQLDGDEETLKTAAALAEGSPGRGALLALARATGFLEDIQTLFARLPRLDDTRLRAVMTKLSDKNKDAALQSLFYETCLKQIAIMARAAARDGHLVGVSGLTQQKQEGGRQPTPVWLALREKIQTLFYDAEALNLDPARLAQAVFFSARDVAQGKGLS